MLAELGGKAACTWASECQCGEGNTGRALTHRAGPHLVNKASISYGGSEHTLDIYEVLCGPSDDSILQWRDYMHGEKAFVDGWQPVEGGRERDGKAVFIAKGEYER